MTASTPQGEADDLTEGPRPFDPSVPSPARMWNYWVGGKDHFAADRASAERIAEAIPALPALAKLVRAFLRDIVQTLAAEHGIRQFLDIGTGLPTADNTHEVAQRAAPESRIVYADYDPSVLAHARALLTSTPEGRTAYVQADLRDTDTIVKAAGETLDFSQPVAILLFAVLHFIQDEDDPYRIIRKLVDAVPSGSYLVILHAPSDLFPSDAIAEHNRRYNNSGAERIRPRSQEEVSRFFDGLELVPPGIATLSEWLDGHPLGTGAGQAWVGVARKP
ncbi:MAG TPA: SAM-dependent methyltransferase [Trebonia sp.]|nr:SAM-dependent methyltransferase [Trebonia sp.]